MAVKRVVGWVCILLSSVVQLITNQEFLLIATVSVFVFGCFDTRGSTGNTLFVHEKCARIA